MKYALGNMLNGAGSLNPDGLSLDLQFATDKTLTARKGPTPVFTRASTATFVGSNGLIQTAAVNEPRFDHDPITLACKGLLIEESRTNLYPRSEEFETVSWAKTRSSITANATTAPDGTLTADKLVEDTTASNTHTSGSSVTPPATAHTLSVFAKKGERTWIVLRLGGNNTFFNLDDGTIAAGSVNSPTITNFGDGWYRCTVTSSAGTQGSFHLATNSTTTSYTGDGTSGLFLWGAQLEAGSFATSYIPTTTASVVRSDDVCSITGDAFSGFYNQSEGTVIVNGDSAGASGSRWCGTSPTRAFELYGKTNLVYFESSGITETPIGAISLPTKFGLACKLNDFQGVRNGTLGGADTNATMPSPTTFHIGNLLGTSSWLNGCISSIRYFKKRLPNAKLQTLTA